MSCGFSNNCDCCKTCEFCRYTLCLENETEGFIDDFCLECIRDLHSSDITELMKDRMDHGDMSLLVEALEGARAYEKRIEMALATRKKIEATNGPSSEKGLNGLAKDFGVRPMDLKRPIKRVFA